MGMHPEELYSAGAGGGCSIAVPGARCICASRIALAWTRTVSGLQSIYCLSTY